MRLDADSRGCNRARQVRRLHAARNMRSSSAVLLMLACTQAPQLATSPLATESAGPRVYVANQISGSVSVIDASTDTVIATIPTGFNCNSLAVSPSGERLYVTVPTSLDAVLSLDTATLAATTTLAASGHVNGTAFSPDGRRAWVTPFHENRVLVVDTASEETVGSVATGDTPVGIAVSPDGTRVYVADQGASALTVIDAQRLAPLATIPVGHWPRGVVASRDGRRVYVSNTDVEAGGRTISIVDPAALAVVGTVNLAGVGPNGMALTADGRWLYTANVMSNDVSVIDTQSAQEAARIPAGSYPFELVLDADERKLYVTSHQSASVIVIGTDTRQVLTTVPVGDSPLGIAYAARVPAVSNRGVPPLGRALRDAGLLTAGEAARIARLGGESGFGVYAAPAVPGAGERVVVAVVAEGAGAPQAASSIARWTRDGWRTQTDTAASAFAQDGLAGLLFDLGSSPARARMELALRVGEALWLSKSGSNYALAVRPPDRVAWAGSLGSWQNGLPRAPAGDTIFSGHELVVAGESWPQVPDAHAVLHWSSNGFAAIHHLPMSIDAVGAGPTGENTRWLASLDGLAAGRTLTYWFEVASALGGFVDGRSGQNYGGPVATPPAPGWGEVGAYLFSKCHDPPNDCHYGWYYGSGMADPLSATPADYQVYAPAPAPAVELWVPGVTDAGLPVAADFIRVEVWSPFFAGRTDGPWKAHAMAFKETHGNNWRYEWQVRIAAAAGMPAIGADVPCPADGDYPFKFRVSTDGGASWSWLGTGGFPDGGANRTLHWENLPGC